MGDRPVTINSVLSLHLPMAPETRIKSTSRPSGEWSDDDFDVLCNGAVVGRIMRAASDALEGTQWMWTLTSGTTRTARRRMATLRRASSDGGVPKSWRGE
jgi:hypothetical protein